MLTGLFWAGFHVLAAGQGIQMLSNPVINVQSASDYQNGVTVGDPTLQISQTLGVNITLQVRASGNLTRSTSSIPISLLFMQVTNSTPIGAEIQLSTTAKTLYSGSASGITNRPIIIRYRLAPSSSLQQPAGAYTTTLTFTYTSF